MRAKCRRRELPAELVARLGTVSDAKIAREFGVAATTVYTWRTRRGIKPFEPKMNQREGTHDGMTDAQLDAVIEEQRQRLPRWWLGASVERT